MRDVLTEEECLQIAAQCWCDDETAKIEMDTRLAQAFAKRLAEAARLGAERERERAARVCATLPAFQKQHDGSYVPTTPLDCAIAIRRGEE